MFWHSGPQRRHWPLVRLPETTGSPHCCCYCCCGLLIGNAGKGATVRTCLHWLLTATLCLSCWMTALHQLLLYMVVSCSISSTKPSLLFPIVTVEKHDSQLQSKHPNINDPQWRHEQSITRGSVLIKATPTQNLGQRHKKLLTVRRLFTAAVKMHWVSASCWDGCFDGLRSCLMLHQPGGLRGQSQRWAGGVVTRSRTTSNLGLLAGCRLLLENGSQVNFTANQTLKNTQKY